MPSVMPPARRSGRGIDADVVEAGWVSSERASPSETAREITRTASYARAPAWRPPRTSKAIIAP
jgi:hypothetical protein